MTLKKYRILTILLLCMTILTACGENQIPALSEEEMQQVEEYAAKLLLKYDKNYKANTLTEEEMAKQEEALRKKEELRIQIEEQKALEEAMKAEEEAAKEEQGASGQETAPTENLYTDIDEFLGMNGLQINYTGYEVCDSYPETTENDWQGVARATGNNKLVVFKFAAYNESGADFMLDMGSIAPRVTLRVNGTSTKSVLTTLLMNDFLHFKGNIPADVTEELVMIMEIPAEDAENLSSVVLNMKLNGESAKTTLF